MTNIEELEGVWRSQGYNHLLECTPTGFKFYDLTRISCVESMNLSSEEMAELFDRFQRSGSDQFSMYQKGGITRYDLVRQPALPQVLISQSLENANDPEYNFEVFWHYFAENYAFFELRQVDWDQVYGTFRPRITSETTETELLDIFSEILALLGDDHVTLSAGDRQVESARPNALLRQWQKEFGQESNKEVYMSGFNQLLEFIMVDILQKGAQIAANQRVLWGKAAPNIGYLMVVAMSGFAEKDAPLSEQLSVLCETMDRVMEDFKGLDGVIIDARFNPGGADAASLLVANRFADARRLAFTKKAVTESGFTREQEIFIYPEGETQFTGPVAYLTSEATISAAEIFTLCLMALPHVTRMGEPTQGVLSDVLGKNLPNGWWLGISNEIYTACDGKLYEGCGIPVHVELPIYDENNFYPALKITVDKAIEWLEEKLKKTS